MVVLLRSLDRLYHTKWNRTITNFIHYSCVYLHFHVNMAAVKKVHYHHVKTFICGKLQLMIKYLKNIMFM